MAKGPPVDYEDVRRKTLHAAAKLFLEIGYTAATAKKLPLKRAPASARARGEDRGGHRLRPPIRLSRHRPGHD